MRRRYVPLVLVAALTCMPSTGQSGSIELTVDRSAYRSHQTIVLRLFNPGPDTITYAEGPGCEPSFQRSVDGEWRSLRISAAEESRAPCEQVTLRPRERRTVERRIDLDPPAGSYRARLQHDRGIAYSAPFVIQP